MTWLAASVRTRIARTLWLMSAPPGAQPRQPRCQINGMGNQGVRDGGGAVLLVVENRSAALGGALQPGACRAADVGANERPTALSTAATPRSCASPGPKPEEQSYGTVTGRAGVGSGAGPGCRPRIGVPVQGGDRCRAVPALHVRAQPSGVPCKPPGPDAGQAHAAPKQTRLS
jgi:hypothetical protein